MVKKNKLTSKINAPPPKLLLSAKKMNNLKGLIINFMEIHGIFLQTILTVYHDENLWVRWCYV